jgi:hypothetical protein
LAGYFGVDLGIILTLATTEKKDRQSFESAKQNHVAAAAAAAAVFTERGLGRMPSANEQTCIDVAGAVQEFLAEIMS